MFWRMQGTPQASPIEAILDKDSFGLEELLDEDDFIQEVKSMNSRVISHLQQTRVIAQLLDYIVVPPLEGARASSQPPQPPRCGVSGLPDTDLTDSKPAGDWQPVHVSVSAEAEQLVHACFPGTQAGHCLRQACTAHC